MLWGYYWDASNCVTIPTMVAKPKYRRTAAVVSGDLSLSFGVCSHRASQRHPAGCGLSVDGPAAIFLLPEVYGFED
jgi:hypothetical protein